MRSAIGRLVGEAAFTGGCKSHTCKECRGCGGLAVAEARTCKRAHSGGG